MENRTLGSHFARLPTLAELSDINNFNWTLADWEGRAKTTVAIGTAFGFWFFLQFLVRWYLFGRWHFRTFDYFKFGRSRRGRAAPPSTELEVVPKNRKWRISNEAVSLIHSVVSGLWALYAILTYPLLIHEMTTFSHPLPKILVYLSFGYIIHDLIDLLWNERSARILELLFHHVVVILAFLITLVTNNFLGLVTLGLLMEINSIFLHSRSLMNLYRMEKNSTGFRFVALLNILTFLLFRIAVCIFLLYWQISNFFNMYWYQALLNFLVIASLSVTNSVLLYRVLSADGLLGASRTRRPTAEPETKENGELDGELNDDDDEEEEDEVDARPAVRTTRQSTAGTQTNEEAVLNTPPDVVVQQ